MAALFGVMGFPPTLKEYFRSMYFHSIGIGIAALAVYAVIWAFELEKVEPRIDFPLSLRAWVATIFAAVGGLIYINPGIQAALADIGLGLFVVAFLLIADAGGALYVELMLLPRKRAGVYQQEAGYWRRMFPFTRAKLQPYLHQSAAYWLTICAVGSTFVAGLIGFANLWVSLFGTSFLSGYISWLGLDKAGFLAGSVDPHSHDMAVAILAGIVAITVYQYGVMNKVSGLKKQVARVGLWISIIGLIVMTWTFISEVFLNYAPPLLFASQPLTSTGGVDLTNGIPNGMVGDDLIMAIPAIGAMLLIIPLALTKLDDSKPFWKDSVRGSILAIWVAAVLTNAIEGFYVEFNENVFQTTLFVNDRAYAQMQSLGALFVLAAGALILLAVDNFKLESTTRRLVGWVTSLGLLLFILGGFAWTFIDATNPGASFWIYIVGTFLFGVAGLIAVAGLYSRRVSSARTLSPSLSSPADASKRTEG
jgi:hypothetical protein